MVIIRADGNAKIGAGHLMRCLTIAEALAELMGGRGKILFCCADETSADLVRIRDFTVRVFGTDYRDMERELPLWEQLYAETSDVTRVILIDSYYTTDTYLKALNKTGVTFLMDDMQERCFPVDAVINYNAFARKELYTELYYGKNTMCYIGGDYVPIRPQFVNCPYQVRDRVQNVLVATGGGDVDNVAGAMLSALLAENEGWRSTQRVNYHVVIGTYNPHLADLEELAAGTSCVFLYHNVQDMAGLMQKCDLAVTAGGTTLYELASVGVPLLCFSYAENQEQLARYIGGKGIAGYAGEYHRNARRTLFNMRNLFAEYCTDARRRNECYLKEKALVDGRGARRIAEKLLEYENSCG